ncbi:MAG: cytochrome ubiquinol oxidase subunit II [Legionellales bacterium]|nr:cytochrome ubiquinol oxidase subunit II [Legionellales bacterium]
MLTPKGVIAKQQHKLLFDVLFLMLIVVVPVIIMSFAFAYEFSRKRRRWKYTPEWSHNTLLEVFWWGIPTVIILILSIITWNKTHELDPYNKIAVDGEVEVIEAVALRWKWLFIYPKEQIVTINEIYFPVGKQVEFHITADAPMSAFCIPQLGGQIYAMAGMRTRLHLYTENEGVYEGLNTQLNGDGFSDMHFLAHVVPQDQFDSWVQQVKLGSLPLTLDRYKELYNPTIAAPIEHYSAAPGDLFMKIMMQYTQANSWLH